MTNDGKSRVLPLDAFRSLATENDVNAFIAQYSHPFLVLETKEGDFGEMGFQTLATKLAEEADTPEKTEEPGTITDLDIQLAQAKTPAPDKPAPEKKPVVDRNEQLQKKLSQAKLVTYVCPLVKRDVNKFASMITVGRAANNDIRLNLPSISKFHAYFTHVQSNDTWFLADANSSNGTFVNGERLKTRTKVEPGVSIRLGSDVSLRFFDARAFYQFLRQNLTDSKG